jgi:hypothetical protein
MDSDEKCLVAGLGALALGVTIGWYLRVQNRRPRAAGASKPASASSADDVSLIHVGGAATSSCGCRS